MFNLSRLFRSIFHPGKLNLVCVKPEKRMDGLVFNPLRGYDHQVNVADYTCPHCSRKIRFTTSNFDDAVRWPEGVLSRDHAREFDRTRPVKKKRWEDFLDFYCPGCRNPVRIIFQVRSVEAMKGYSFEVTDIVEVAKLR